MLNIVHMVRVNALAQYDGTNGAEIVAQFGGTLVSDNGLQLVFRAQNNTENIYCDPGQWVWWTDTHGFEAVMGVVDQLPGFPLVQLPA